MDIIRVIEELDLEDVQYQPGDRVVAKCPFGNHEHDHERPGFSIFTDSGHWICFKGCGQGDVITLVAKRYETSFKEARAWLAKYAHVDVKGVISRITPKKTGQTEESVINYYQEDYDRQDSTKISRYILNRGFTKKILKDWGVRMDPYLHCLVIPVYDINNKIVGLIRREVPGHELPTRTKYWYSSGFNCADYLFGINHHNNSTSTIVVEGSLDTIWLHQLGYTNTVAVLGAYCSPKQGRLLAKLGNTVYLGFDMDDAGREARARMLKDFGKMFIFKDIEWPKKDPQECTTEEIEGAMSESYGIITRKFKYKVR
jgi:DNA primase